MSFSKDDKLQIWQANLLDPPPNMTIQVWKHDDGRRGIGCGAVRHPDLWLSPDEAKALARYAVGEAERLLKSAAQLLSEAVTIDGAPMRVLTRIKRNMPGITGAAMRALREEMDRVTDG